jgi:hypothetical protein
MEPNEPLPKENDKNKVNTSNKEEESQRKHQVPLGYKRPITSSGFKTQSWADIKNREKEMEEERKKKSEGSGPTTREPPPPSLVFRNLNRNSASAIRPKSWVAPKSFNPILPSVYKPPGSSKQSTTTNDTKSDHPGSPSSEQTKSAAPPTQATGEPKQSSASTAEKEKSSKTEAVEPLKHKPVVIIPSPPSAEATTKNDTDNSRSSQSTTQVVMRKKTDPKPGLGEKRKSVQDMMSMFGVSKDNRRNSDDATPQQSPAMRSLEEKISKPNKQYGISTLVNTLSTKPAGTESKSDSKNESKTVESSAKPTVDTKVKGDAATNAQRVYKIILADDKDTTTSHTTAKKEETKKESTEASESKPRANSLNPRQQYNVLFPTKNETSSNSTESTKSSSSSHENKDHTSSGKTSVGGKEDQEKRSDTGVTVREKDSSRQVDPFKRHSMPAYVLEKETRPQPEGGNVSIHRLIYL